MFFRVPVIWVRESYRWKGDTEMRKSCLFKWREVIKLDVAACLPNMERRLTWKLKITPKMKRRQNLPNLHFLVLLIFQGVTQLGNSDTPWTLGASWASWPRLPSLQQAGLGLNGEEIGTKNGWFLCWFWMPNWGRHSYLSGFLCGPCISMKSLTN